MRTVYCFYCCRRFYFKFMLHQFDQQHDSIKMSNQIKSYDYFFSTDFHAFCEYKCLFCKLLIFDLFHSFPSFLFFCMLECSLTAVFLFLDVTEMYTKTEIYVYYGMKDLISKQTRVQGKFVI